MKEKIRRNSDRKKIKIKLGKYKKKEKDTRKNIERRENSIKM